MEDFIDKYFGNKPKNRRNCLHFLKYKCLKFIRSNIVKGFLKFIGVILFLIFILFLWFIVSTWYDYNIRYSIAMPDITGYFIKNNDGFTANGIYTISQKEKDNGEKSASLLFGTINCYYKEKCCKEELVHIMNFAGIVMYPYIWEYDITYRDKNRIIYSDGYKTSVVVDLNQETITKTIYKTFMRETPKIQIDEFITDNTEIYKEEKRVIRKHLKRRLF